MKSTSLFFCMLFFSMALFSQQYKTTECVIENGVLKTIEAQYDPASGNKTVSVSGTTKSLEEAYPDFAPGYAARAAWYINNDPLPLNGKRYVKYGLPRILGIEEITKSGTYQGIGIYVEAGTTGVPEVIYVPVRRGCEFQPYMVEIPPCGTVRILPSVKAPRQGQNIVFTAYFSGLKGKLTYEWIVEEGTVIGSRSGKSVTVSTKNFSGALTVQVNVKVEGKACTEASEYFTTEVK